MASMTVYETADSGATDDAMRFSASVAKLAAVGITVARVVVDGPGSIPEGEVRDIVTEEGFSALPAAEFGGVAVCTGAYPTDQELADFLDVPDGVLSVNRSRGPAMANDIPPACGIRPR